VRQNLRFLDLFAGAGGLSEGFIRAGFTPIAHVESDKAACYTLKTRIAYHWLKANDKQKVYTDYLENQIDRTELYGYVPKKQIDSVINQEINEENLSSIFTKIDLQLGSRNLDLIIGGPPCQAYSIVGRSRDQNGMKGDKRNYLYRYYAEFLKRYKPKYFLFENVLGLLSAKDEEGKLYLDNMRSLFLENGYSTEYKILTAEDYGVLQKRKRIILVGFRGKKTEFYPEPEKWNPNLTVNEVFRDLPFIKAGEGHLGVCRTKKYTGQWLHQVGIKNEDIPVTMHQSRPNTQQDLEIYKIAVELWNKKQARLDYNSLPSRLKTHQNRSSFVDRFKVVASTLPCSHTIVAHIAKDGHYYIHPDIRQNRSLTPREAARIQTFPDDYYFESSSGTPARTPALKQIGNAVPVYLAEKIAITLKENW
tara:strand:- start:112922 stop:114181 length:1260 start_codon:yes stop_codon:yes gene_type:complete